MANTCVIATEERSLWPTRHWLGTTFRNSEECKKKPAHRSGPVSCQLNLKTVETSLALPPELACSIGRRVRRELGPGVLAKQAPDRANRTFESVLVQGRHSRLNRHSIGSFLKIAGIDLTMQNQMIDRPVATADMELRTRADGAPNKIFGRLDGRVQRQAFSQTGGNGGS